MDGIFPANNKEIFDKEALNKLLTELKLTDKNNNGIKEYKDRELTLEIAILSDSEEKEVVRIVKEDLEEIGFKVEIKEYNVDEFEKKIIKPRNYQAVIFGQSYGEEMSIYPFWHSGQFKTDGLKLSSISSKRIDALLENYQKEFNQQKKQEIIKTISIILKEEKYAVFLYQPLYNFVTDKRIKGLKRYGLIYPEEKFINIHNWHVNTNINLLF